MFGDFLNDDKYELFDGEERNSSTSYNSIILIAGIGLLLYYWGIVNMYAWIIILCYYLLRHCNKTEIGFFSLIFGSGLFGRCFASQSFYIATIVIFLLLGIILLYKEILKILNSNLYPYLFLVILIVFYLVYYLLGPQTEYANEKILKLIVRGFIWLTAFLLFVQSEDISSKRIGLAFLVTSLFYLSQSYNIYGIRPSSFFDFTFFRDFCVLVGKSDLEYLFVSYHTLGYLAFASLIFWIMSDDYFKSINANSILFTFLAFFIITISGARQVFFGSCIIFLLRTLIEKDESIISFSNITKILLFGSVIIALTLIIGSEYYDSIFNADLSSTSRLNRDTDTPLKVMSINPLVGVGFGGYPLYANKDYPHNLFVEILCEMGYVGLLAISLLIVVFLYSNKNKVYLRYKTQHNSYLFPLLLLMFLRTQISGDLADSMCLFALLFSFTPLISIDTDAKLSE